MSHLSGLACEQALFRISASEANRARTREQGAPASVSPSALRRRRQRQLQKAIGLDWQNNNFARASRFFVHFFAVPAQLRREMTKF